MLSRLVRNQLIIFTIASIVGLSLLSFKYIQAPTLLGVGRITVELELPASGGLYRFGNVTYRGVQVGKVTKVAVRNARYVVATLSLDTSARIPADLVARVLSMSAVGEQYVDLQPRNDSAPYLADGSVIGIQNTTIPQKVGPMLDQLGSLLDSIPQDRLTVLLDESFKAFNGAGYDFGSLIDSSTTVAADLREVADQTRTLIDDSEPLLNSQAQGSENIRTWIRSLAGVTDQIRANDPQVRTLLQRVPGAADEVSRLLADLKPTLPILLANLKTIGQISVTYNPSLEQLLVLLPPGHRRHPGGGTAQQPNRHGEGRLRHHHLRSAGVHRWFPSSFVLAVSSDVSDIDTPEGMYCKLPQDSPIGVRGGAQLPPLHGTSWKARPPDSAVVRQRARIRPPWLSVSTPWGGRIPSTRIWWRRGGFRRIAESMRIHAFMPPLSRAHRYRRPPHPR